MPANIIPCANHSGIDERLNNLYLKQQAVDIKVQDLEDKIEAIETHVFKAVNRIYFILITILSGLVLNLGVLFFQGLQK
jgi:hypothetical protein